MHRSRQGWDQVWLPIATPPSRSRRRSSGSSWSAVTSTAESSRISASTSCRRGSGTVLSQRTRSSGSSGAPAARAPASWSPAASSHQNGRWVPTRPGSTKATAGMPRARSSGRPARSRLGWPSSNVSSTGRAGSGGPPSWAAHDVGQRHRGRLVLQEVELTTELLRRVDSVVGQDGDSPGRPSPEGPLDRRAAQNRVGRMPNAGHAHPSPDGHRRPKVAPAPWGTGDVDGRSGPRGRRTGCGSVIAAVVGGAWGDDTGDDHLDAGGGVAGRRHLGRAGACPLRPGRPLRHVRLVRRVGACRAVGVDPGGGPRRARRRSAGRDLAARAAARHVELDQRRQRPPHQAGARDRPGPRGRGRPRGAGPAPRHPPPPAARAALARSRH